MTLFFYFFLIINNLHSEVHHFFLKLLLKLNYMFTVLNPLQIFGWEMEDRN